MTTQADTLTAFLLRRIEDDEAVARAALDRGFGGWEDFADRGVNYEERTHIARHDPARVLAECAAKRKIVELHRVASEPEGLIDRIALPPVRAGLDGTLRALASVYADSPEWREGWAL